VWVVRRNVPLTQESDYCRIDMLCHGIYLTHVCKQHLLGEGFNSPRPQHGSGCRRREGLY